MRAIVTGSREWADWETIRDVLADLPKAATVIHGGARGADQTASVFAQALGLAQEEYPADWDRYGKAAGSIRNQAMIDAGADLVLAFPIEGSRGTWDCVRRAETAGILVRVIRPTVDA